MENMENGTEEKQSITGETNVEMDGETIARLIETDAGKKVIQSKLDKHFATSLETWKQNNIQSIVDQEINKRFPAETEDQKQLRTLQQKIETIEREKTYATIKAEAMQELSNKGMSTNLVDFFVSDNSELTKGKIESFAVEFKNAVDQEVDNRMKKVGMTPKNIGGETIQTGEITKSDLMKMNYNQRAEFFTKNPDLFNQIMSK